MIDPEDLARLVSVVATADGACSNCFIDLLTALDETFSFHPATWQEAKEILESVERPFVASTERIQPAWEHWIGQYLASVPSHMRDMMRP